MCLLVEVRPEDELVAAEALLALSNFYSRPQQSAETPNAAQMSIESTDGDESTAKLSIVTSTPQPGKRPRQSFEKKKVRESITLSVDSNEQSKDCQKPVESVKLIPKKPKTSWALSAMALFDMETPSVNVAMEKVPASKKACVKVPAAKVTKASASKSPALKSSAVKPLSPKTPPSKSPSSKSPISLPNLPATSKSGRVVKRTRRFISQSDDDGEQSKNLAKEGGVPKIETTTKVMSIEDVQPAKKRKISTPVPPPSPSAIKVTPSKIMHERSLNVFGKDLVKTLQHEKLRHSRFFQMKFEMQHYAAKGASVNFQLRAAENLRQYKEVVENKQNETFSNRSEILNLVKKFRQIENREQICDEFKSIFKTTTCNRWKPFGENAERKTEIIGYNLKQAMKKAQIKRLVDVFVKQNHSKESGRAILIELLKLLPERPEVRHEFFNIHLPKIIAINKSAQRKGSRTSKKEALQVNPAYEIYF